MGNICRATKSRRVINPIGFDERYVLVEKLGDGGFGEVYTCVETHTSKEFAAKLVTNSQVTEWSKTDVERVPMEVKTLATCDHPFIIKLMDYFVFTKHSIIIMEKPRNTVDLFNYTAYLGGLSENEARPITQQIVEAVHYLHYDARIVHRDLKPENVLVDVRDRSIKIIDFGAAGWFHPNIYTQFAGTRLYAPPELLLTGRYKAEPLTTWSIGALLYFILHCRLPFADEHAILNSRPAISNQTTLSTTCLQFMATCLAPLPSTRPTVDGLIRHEWLKNIGFYFK